MTLLNLERCINLGYSIFASKWFFLLGCCLLLCVFVHPDTLEPPQDVSPGNSVSSDGGGSFQLMKKEEGERLKEERKRGRKYRGPTEEALEGEC